MGPQFSIPTNLVIQALAVHAPHDKPILRLFRGRSAKQLRFHWLQEPRGCSSRTSVASLVRPSMLLGMLSFMATSRCFVNKSVTFSTDSHHGRTQLQRGYTSNDHGHGRSTWYPTALHLNDLLDCPSPVKGLSCGRAALVAHLRQGLLFSSCLRRANARHTGTLSPRLPFTDLARPV